MSKIRASWGKQLFWLQGQRSEAKFLLFTPWADSFFNLARGRLRPIKTAIYISPPCPWGFCFVERRGATHTVLLVSSPYHWSLAEDNSLEHIHLRNKERLQMLIFLCSLTNEVGQIIKHHVHRNNWIFGIEIVDIAHITKGQTLVWRVSSLSGQLKEGGM